MSAMKKKTAKYSKSSIVHEQLTHWTTEYINQLLRVNDWKQALLVTSYIPIPKLRKQVVFKILQSKAIYTLKELPVGQAEIQNFLLKDIKIPDSLLLATKAMVYETLGFHENGIKYWMIMRP
jgi:hypothetical protein